MVRAQNSKPTSELKIWRAEETPIEQCQHGASVIVNDTEWKYKIFFALAKCIVVEKSAKIHQLKSAISSRLRQTMLT